MEKLENVADQTHLIHSHRKSISSDGTLHEEDEFCYEEDDFEEPGSEEEDFEGFGSKNNLLGPGDTRP